MKLVMTLSILLMGTAVFAQQKRPMRVQVGERSEMIDKSPAIQSDVKGVVRMNDGACGIFIETPGKEGANLHPVNLPDDFKVDGKNIFFDYGRVDHKLRSQCEMAVLVSNVKPRRLAYK
jgi:hypothetical protein